MEKALGVVLTTGGLMVVVSGGAATAESSHAPHTGTSAALRQQPITMSDLTPGFTLAGSPNQVVFREGAVTLTVRTPDPDGYSVSVRADSAAMRPARGGNPDRIPVDRLAVRKTGTATFQPLSSSSAVTVHAQDTRSAPRGDNLSTDYRVSIPFVRSDTYRVILTYTATTR
ncbi:hypothetical protein E3E14_29255 [Streptomyces sp. ICN441]|uniref:Uncharacterized protein n=1 Tax=Streptomyces tirandamycinicus TaxID=2174846 RepID=A0A2S1SPF3_9ACTN|nr:MULTISPECIES: hypothetical protein [Streptomyces]AWI28271.1 hypothetical protein DDW44_05275 [Streptomyces tirandamycinicus]TFE38281.1 hypothetical protein E3E14_29255 [Streptomyces sp. ICN441]